jgi:hypothetical protein
MYDHDDTFIHESFHLTRSCGIASCFYLYYLATPSMLFLECCTRKKLSRCIFIMALSGFDLSVHILYWRFILTVFNFIHCLSHLFLIEK